MLPRIHCSLMALMRSERCVVRTLTSMDGPSQRQSTSSIQSNSIPQLPPLQRLQQSLPETPPADKPLILDIPPESDPLLAYITSWLMKDGKRHAAARRTSRLLLHLYAMTRSPPLPLLRKAVAYASPSIRIVSHKQGVKTLQKPMPLSERQRTHYAVKWLLEAAKERDGKQVEERLAREVLGVINQDPNDRDPKNLALQKKKAMHNLGMVNRANVKTRG